MTRRTLGHRFPKRFQLKEMRTLTESATPSLGDLLLEGTPREVLARNIGVSAGNDFALLQAVGGDCAGALMLLDPDSEPAESPQTQSIDEAQLDHLLTHLPQRPLAAHLAAGIRLSLAGAQPKLPIIVEGDKLLLPSNSAAATTHIIKPEPDRFPQLVENETFCMRLAREVGLPVAEVDKRSTASGLSYLLATRYDRDHSVHPTRRLHQEDFCQALSAPSDRKYQSEGGPTAVQAVSLLRSCSAAPAIDLRTLWQAFVFNWLIGNCDAHGKNFSLIYTGATPRLAPLYDLVSTTVYGELTTRLAMSIGGATDIGEVRWESWERLAQDCGFSQRFARSETRLVVDRVLSGARKPDGVEAGGDSIVSSIVQGIQTRGEMLLA